MNKASKSLRSVTWRCVQRLVRRLSAWALRDELRLQQNVNEDAQSLVDALLRGERADAYCGYGRDGQASNYRDELKWSLRELQKLNSQEMELQTHLSSDNAELMDWGAGRCSANRLVRRFYCLRDAWRNEWRDLRFNWWKIWRWHLYAEGILSEYRHQWRLENYRVNEENPHDS